jgi:hypothetical protein
VELLRQFKVGENLKYQVRSLLVLETKRLGLPYFQPSDMEINYDSSIEVKKLKTDGFAEVVYKRPTMDIVEGETSEEDRKVNKERVNMNFALTLSPINEFTNAKDLNPPKPAPRSSGAAKWASPGFGSTMQEGESLPFVGELYRLALFVGSLDTAIDLSPKLPYDEVRPGAAWKMTASYQPQTLKGAKGKMAVQRLDWTYTYDGVVTSQGKRVHRITGVLKLDTDLGAFFNQAAGVSAGESDLEKLPVKLDSKVTFDLDLNTRHTLSALAETKGTWSLKMSGLESNFIEEKISGRTTLTLVSK